MTYFQLAGTLLSILALFGYLNHRFVRLPDTIGITAIGLVCSLIVTLCGSRIPHFTDVARDFAHSVNFSEVVFHGLLGMLLFAGSLHINLNQLNQYRVKIFSLSTIAVALSTAIIGVGAYYLFARLGLHIPLAYCLVFGAVISPTDPIAVMGILKTARVPVALETGIAGESLFNDGTAVVLFVVLLNLATGSVPVTAASVALLLLKEVVGGIGFGLVCGYLGFFLLKGIKSYAIEIIITLAWATGGYALAESMHVSAPLAVVIMGLVIGNHGAYSAMSDETRNHLFDFWGLIDEVLTLVLFGMIGLSVMTIDIQKEYLLVSVLVVPLALVARYVSVAIPLRSIQLFGPITPYASEILTWGGLRGGISVALALSMPEFDGKDALLMCTYSVVLFSLLVQAPTLGPLLRRLHVCPEKLEKSANRKKALSAELGC